MRALFLRFYRFTGFWLLMAILFGCLTGVLALAAGQSFGRLSGVTWTWLAAIAMVAGTVVAATKYRRSSATRGYEEILIPLIQSEREYCLVLRPFGRDGEIIVPKAESNGRVGAGLLTYNMTIEQVLATAARVALGVETYGIVDQNVSFAPPGLTFMRASNDDWQLVARRLIRRAHSVMLILPPGRDIGEGFAWEINQIVRYRMQSRVIIVLPPDDPDSPAHQEALIQASVVLALLDGSGTQANLSRTAAHEYQPRLPANTLIVKCSTEKSDPRTWGVTLPGDPQPRMRRKQKMVVTDSTYLPGLVEALKETENELPESGFAARYSHG